MSYVLPETVDAFWPETLQLMTHTAHSLHLYIKARLQKTLRKSMLLGNHDRSLTKQIAIMQRILMGSLVTAKFCSRLAFHVH